MYGVLRESLLNETQTGTGVVDNLENFPRPELGSALFVHYAMDAEVDIPV